MILETNGLTKISWRASAFHPWSSRTSWGMNSSSTVKCFYCLCECNVFGKEPTWQNWMQRLYSYRMGAARPDRTSANCLNWREQTPWVLMEGLNFPNREVSTFLDKERNPSLSSHPFLPLPILSLSFLCHELLLLWLCAGWMKVMRSPSGHPHSWEEEGQFHRLLDWLYGSPASQAPCSSQRVVAEENRVRTAATLQHRSESRKQSRREGTRDT